MSVHLSQRRIAVAAEVAERSVRRWQHGLPVRPVTERRICRAVAELEKQAAANAELRERHQPRGSR